MKTNIVGIIIALILTFVGMLSVYAQDTKVSEVRKVDAFSSIEITSVGTIYFTQSDTYSFKIEGKEKHVKNTETTVKDGCLLIGFKDRKNKSMRNQKDGVTIWISAPDLKKVEFPHFISKRYIKFENLCPRHLMAYQRIQQWFKSRL